MAIIRITKEEIAEADAARKAALQKDSSFREDEARRQVRRDVAIREMERRRSAVATEDDRTPVPARRPCPEDAQPRARDIARDERPQP
jgi:Arc/MetJ family transcription regulator